MFTARYRHAQPATQISMWKSAAKTEFTPAAPLPGELRSGCSVGCPQRPLF
jgi:hypothetical protein